MIHSWGGVPVSNPHQLVQPVAVEDVGRAVQQVLNGPDKQQPRYTSLFFFNKKKKIFSVSWRHRFRCPFFVFYLCFMDAHCMLFFLRLGTLVGVAP